MGVPEQCVEEVTLLGERVFFNFNCVVLDIAPVLIGSGVLFGPSVQIYTATHPLRATASVCR